jgi:nicotinamidase-related amidase
MQILKGKEVYDNIFEIINPEHTAVLVIDMQNDLCQPDGYFGRRGSDISITRGIVLPLAKFLEEARSVGVKIIYLQQSTPPNAVGDSPAWLRFKQIAYGLKPGEKDDYMVEGTRGYEWVEELKPREGDIIVKKTHATGFVNTPLDLILRSNGIKSLVITGAASYGCVLNTVMDASCYDYYIVLVKDLLAGPNRELHEAALKIMGRRYDCVESAAILAEWARYTKRR